MQNQINVKDWKKNLQMFRDYADNENKQADDRFQLVQSDPQDLSLKTRNISVAKGKEGLLTRALFRSVDDMLANDAMRELFLRTIASLFGGSVENIPKEIQDAMLLKKFDHTGRPLTTRRIRAVFAALDNYTNKLETRANAIRNAVPFIGESERDGQKLSILVSSLYEKVSPSLTKSINKLVKEPTLGNKVTFLRQFNAEVMRNFSKAALESGQYGANALPGLEDLVEAREILLRFIMHEKPQMKMELLTLSENDFATLTEILNNEKPKDMSKEFAWVQDLQFIEDIKQMINPFNVEELVGRIKEKTADMAMTGRLGFAKTTMKPYWRNLSTMIPEELREVVTNFETYISREFSDISQMLQNESLNNIGLYNRLCALKNEKNNLMRMILSNKDIDDSFRNVIEDHLNNISTILEQTVLKEARSALLKTRLALWETRASTIREVAPFVGISEKKQKKFSIIASCLYEKLSPSMKECINNLVQKSTQANKEAFLRQFNDEINGNIDEAVLVSGLYEESDSPGVDEIVNIREMLLRFIMHEHKKIAVALLTTSKNEFESMTKNVRDNVPKDMSLQYAWIQNEVLLGEINLMIHPCGEQSVDDVIKEKTANKTMPEKLGFAEETMKTYWRNLATLSPENLRETFKSLETHVSQELHDMSQKMQNEPLDKKSLYNRLCTLTKEINELNDSIKANNDINEELRGLINTQLINMNDIIEYTVAKDLRPEG